MKAFVFKPSNQYIGKFEVVSPDEVPHKVQNFIDQKDIPQYSYIESGGRSWTILSLDPFDLRDGRIEIPAVESNRLSRAENQDIVKQNESLQCNIFHILRESHIPNVVTIDQLQNMLSTGELTGEEYAWQDGWDEWRQISSVDEFQPPEVSHSSQILDSPPCVPEPSEDANKSKSAFAGISILTFIFVIIGAVMGKDCAQNSTGNNRLPTYTTPTNKHNSSAYQDLEANLRKVADRLNRDLPKLVDKETRLELTKSGPGREFTYMYTLVNMYASDINPRDFAANMRLHLLQSYKSEPGMKYFRDNNVKVHYIYVDPDASTIALISISPEDF